MPLMLLGFVAATVRFYELRPPSFKRQHRWQLAGASKCTLPAPQPPNPAGDDPSMVNPHFLHLGLPRDVCAALVNPGFFDPFDPAADITLDNPAYRWGAERLGGFDCMLCFRTISPQLLLARRRQWRRRLRGPSVRASGCRSR